MKILIAIFALALAAGCASESSAPQPRAETPVEETEDFSPQEAQAVIDAVREVFPNTRTDDIEYTFQDILEQAPDATHEQAAGWIIEALTWNEQVDAWNDCLDSSPTGAGCVEADEGVFSDDNPLHW